MERDGSTTSALWVGNLHRDVTAQQLKEVFGERKLQVSEVEHKPEARGAFVRFETCEEAEEASGKFEQHELLGKQMQVRHVLAGEFH